MCTHLLLLLTNKRKC